MYLCLECCSVFEEPDHYIETHGFEAAPYEHYDGCPKCGGAYAEAHECDLCGEWVTGEYVKLKDGTIFCEDCYEVRDVQDD